MLFVIQSAVLCVLFTILMVIMFLSQDRTRWIMNYPPAVRERVATLPQYKDTLAQTEKKHLAKKILSGLLIALIFAGVLWFSGFRTFVGGFFWAFGLFAISNLYDLLVLDWLWFCRSRKARIPGTEDMDKEYGDKLFHFIAFLKGLGIGVLVSAVAAGLTTLTALLLAR